MRMKLKPLPALITLALLGCGGGGDSAGPQGSTVNTTTAAAGSLIACVDVNANWQCDDGDASRSVSATGYTGLTPQAGKYTLIESRDALNRRTRLLVSQAGSASVSGHSTLRTFLSAAGYETTAITTLQGKFTQAALESGYATALSSQPIALAALDAYSRAVAEQDSAAPTLAAYSPTLGSAATATSWSNGSSTEETRRLSAQSGTVLNNSESNRLYLFDAAADSLSPREIDLIPALPQATASYPRLLRRSLALLDRLVSVFVDTASAATTVNGEVDSGSAVVLEPGKGITGIQLVNGGSDAFVLLNMLDGTSRDDACGSTADGREGLFRIGLSDSGTYRWLQNAPACVHSGLTLLAADAAGARVAAWDSISQRLWVMDGSSLTRSHSLDLGLSASRPPQALGLTPGGRYLAVGSYGVVTLVDLKEGRVVRQLSGAWGDVTQVAFARGGRQLLVASAHQVHSLLLDDGLGLLSSSATAVSAAGMPLRGLSVSDDGDSWVAVSDTTVFWRSADGAALAQSSLATGLSVQQATLARDRLVLLARGGQDQVFRLMRLSLPMPALATAEE